MKIIVLSLIVFLSINSTTAIIEHFNLENRIELLKRLSDNCNRKRVFMPDLDEIPYNWNFYDLDTLINTRPDGYIARVTFYIQGEKESRILLTPVNTYKVESDPVYEFRLACDESEYTDIRRKVLGQTMVGINHPPLLNSFEPIRITIEVTAEGHVRVYKNNERFPFISGYDSNPTPVKYISFASKNTTLEYYFNCTENTEYDTGRDIIIKDSYPQKFNSLQLIPVNSDSLSDAINQCNEIKNTTDVDVKGCLLLIPSDDSNKIKSSAEMEMIK